MSSHQDSLRREMTALHGAVEGMSVAPATPCPMVAERLLARVSALEVSVDGDTTPVTPVGGGSGEPEVMKLCESGIALGSSRGDVNATVAVGEDENAACVEGTNVDSSDGDADDNMSTSPNASPKGPGTEALSLRQRMGLAEACLGAQGYTPP